MKRRHRPSIALLMSGWLFSDLLLVLFLVGLGSQPVTVPPTPISTVSTPTSSASSPTSPAPPSAPTMPKPPPKEPVLSTKPLCVRASSSSGKDLSKALADNKAYQTAQRAQKAGMVLVWGVSSNSNEGTHNSDTASRWLKERPFFKVAKLRTLWNSLDGGGRAPGDCGEKIRKKNEGNIILEIYAFR